MSDRELVREKVDQAVDILSEFDIDVWLTFVRETSMAPDPALDLIAGVDLTWQSAFLIGRGGETVAIIGHFDAPNVRELAVWSEVIDYHEGVGEPLRATLARLSPDRIGVNFSESDVAADGLSHGMYRVLVEHLRGTPYGERLVSAERALAALRGRKSAREVEKIRVAVAATEELFDEVELFARPGMTQRQIAEFVHGKIEERKLGYAWPAPFDPIVTCGPHSAIGHVSPRDVVLERGHTLHLDLGVQLDGYCSDLQRMWYVLDDGEVAAPAEVQRAFDVVRGAIEAGRAVLRPGVPGWEVDRAARDHVVSHGFAEYMHGLGHLLGRAAHDGATVLAPRWERYAGVCELPVEAGNVFTLELHVVVENRGIVSLEEDVLVGEGGVEYLSTPQMELRYLRS